jgi:hypothetical protein
MSEKISINRQIEEVERELKARSTLFPKMITQGKLKAGDATYLVESLEGVLKTLKWLAANEAEIKKALNGKA